MRVHVETLLPCSVEQAWEVIQSSAFLPEVSAPVVAFEPAEPLTVPERWSDIRIFRVRLFLFGKIPLGLRTISLEFIRPEEHVIQTQEQDSVVRRWQHRMAVRPGPEGQAIYSDTVDIDAGLSTLSVWSFAQWFYRHRHRGWLKVVKRLQAQRGAI